MLLSQSSPEEAFNSQQEQVGFDMSRGDKLVAGQENGMAVEIQLAARSREIDQGDGLDKVEQKRIHVGIPFPKFWRGLCFCC